MPGPDTTPLSDTGAAVTTATAPDAPEALPGAAFFDVDNTLLRGASIFHLARGLYARRFFTSRDIARFAWAQTAFRVLGREDPEHMAQAREAALSFVKGHHIDELRSLGEQIFDEIIARKIWPGTLQLAEGHLGAGQQVWLVTATPVEVAEVIARRLGLTGALGTVSETVHGIYTGRLVGEPLHGQAKADAVRALAVREGLDLARSSAYSDSANDIPMLALVGNPCAVNPDARLRAYARAHGWRVRDYRTGRTAVRIGVPAVAGVGALAGGMFAGLAARRRRQR